MHRESKATTKRVLDTCCAQRIHHEKEFGFDVERLCHLRATVSLTTWNDEGRSSARGLSDFEQGLTRWRGLAWVATFLRSLPGEHDDQLQSVAARVLDVMDRFDPDGPAKFSTDAERAAIDAEEATLNRELEQLGVLSRKISPEGEECVRTLPTSTTQWSSATTSGWRGSSREARPPREGLQRRRGPYNAGPRKEPSGFGSPVDPRATTARQGLLQRQPTRSTSRNEMASAPV